MSAQPYVGPGIWLRVKHRFGPRIPEWFMAGHILMLLPTQTFNHPAFASFRQLVPSEVFLGWAMLVIGCLRIIGVVINGAKKTVTPQVRVFSVSVGCMIWSGSHAGSFLPMAFQRGYRSIRCLP